MCGLCVACFVTEGYAYSWDDDEDEEDEAEDGNQDETVDQDDEDDDDENKHENEDDDEHEDDGDDGRPKNLALLCVYCIYTQSFLDFWGRCWYKFENVRCSPKIALPDIRTNLT